MIVNMVLNIAVTEGVNRCECMGVKMGVTIGVNFVIRIVVSILGVTIGINGMEWSGDDMGLLGDGCEKLLDGNGGKGWFWDLYRMLEE